MTYVRARDGDAKINTHRNCVSSSNTVVAISFPPKTKLISVYAVLYKNMCNVKFLSKSLWQFSTCCMRTDGKTGRY
jgi:hypothetical protein